MVRGQRHRYSGNANSSKISAKPPLTHFLSLPLGHHESLRESVSAFTDGLLASKPMVPGLDRTIAISPRRLHLTLGVMSLEDASGSNITFSDRQTTSTRKTLPEALSLLSSLRPEISELLQGTRLKVPLDKMHIMPPHGGDPDNAHVLWFGPSLENEDAQRLRQVGEKVTKAFRAAGFISDPRPLKLHCTILNTTYRQPRTRGRKPFSYRSVLGSVAGQASQLGPQGAADWRQPVNVDFGTWDVDEIQICKMSSCGPEGEYESCGGLVLRPPPP